MVVYIIMSKTIDVFNIIKIELNKNNFTKFDYNVSLKKKYIL